MGAYTTAAKFPTALIQLLLVCSGIFLADQVLAKPHNSAGHSATEATVKTATQATSKSAAAAGKTFDKPYGSHLEPMLEKIGATADQRKQVTFIVDNYKPKIEPLRVEYRQKSQEFLEFIIHGQPAEVIMARQGELNHLHGDISTEYSLMRLEIRRLLTPDQCRRLEEYRTQQGWTGK